MYINNLETPDPLYKYVDDSTLFEICHRKSESVLQHSVDIAARWTLHNDMKINSDKSKEMLINVMLDRLSEYLDTMGNQLGFKPKLGTDMCIYSLKEIIGRYSQLNGCVFSCFLDASKAFDRVKHSMLFTKLIRRGAPGYIVRLLMFWYAHQTMCVRWAGSVSSKFTVSNGVRQGGILSPFLFNVYGRSVC